ncbi:SRPBCC family protein [Aggregatibacter actinomycetemcomitans]|nr:SRPBCC family protein [Aggregatibacter actinomycetemcomitans]
MEHGYIIKHDDTTYEIHTDILINAPAATVWRILTDFTRMPQWSSLFKGLEGDFTHGGQVFSLYDDPQMGLVKAPHTVYIHDGVKFWWSDEFNVLPGMRDNHHFIVNPVDDNTSRFIQKDTHTGESRLNINGETTTMTAETLTALQLAPFMQFNRELKAECERHQKAT